VCVCVCVIMSTNEVASKSDVLVLCFVIKIPGIEGVNMLLLKCI